MFFSFLCSYLTWIFGACVFFTKQKTILLKNQNALCHLTWIFGACVLFKNSFVKKSERLVPLDLSGKGTGGWQGGGCRDGYFAWSAVLLGAMALPAPSLSSACSQGPMMSWGWHTASLVTPTTIPTTTTTTHRKQGPHDVQVNTQPA